MKYLIISAVDVSLLRRQDRIQQDKVIMKDSLGKEVKNRSEVKVNDDDWP